MLSERFQQRLRRERDRLTRASDMLRLLSPEQTLARGYTITTGADGNVLRSAAAAKAGDQLNTRLRDGTVISVVSAAPPEKTAEPKKRRPKK
jgi:exodeoxyribonuclease VII large subunit